MNPFKSKKGLGRGLSSLIGDTQTSDSNTKVSISSIVRNKYQPRKKFDEESLEELSNSIKVEIADSATFASWANKGNFDRAPGTSASVAAAGGFFESELMSVAFNVNENLSISYGELTETYNAQDNASSAIANVDMESDSIQFAYTMGSMSIKGYQTSTDNPGWDANADADEVTELAVNFAF